MSSINGIEAVELLTSADPAAAMAVRQRGRMPVVSGATQNGIQGFTFGTTTSGPGSVIRLDSADPAVARAARQRGQRAVVVVNSNGTVVPNFFTDSAIDTNFASNTAFLAGVSTPIADLVTVTRASDGYAEDMSGNYTLFSSNVLRRTDKGALVEDSRTNLFLNSATPVTQSITVVAATIYTVSLIGSGSLTLSNAGTGTVTQGSPVTFTAATTTLTVTSSGSHTGAFVNAQVEAGSFATSPIRTAGAAVTRSADIVRTANITWLNASAGTFYVEGSPHYPASALTGTFPSLISIDDNTGTERLNIRRVNSTGGQAGAAVVDGGVAQATPSSSAGSWADTTAHKLAFAYAVNDFALVDNGGSPVTDALGTLPAVTQCQVGQVGGGGQTLNGYVTRFAYAASRLPNATLQQWTAP